MKHLILAATIILVASASAEAERLRQVRYVGVHPVPKAEGGGACYIEGPHVHRYAADKVQYRDHRRNNFFVGDPVAYGYDGPKHAYKGHHPVHVNAVVGHDEPDIEYCYLDGAHYHAFAPAGPDFKLVGGAYFYVGKPPRAYFDGRPGGTRINAVYKPIVYTRPVVTVAPPTGWIQLHVDVVVPVAPAVIIHHHHKHKKFKYKKHKKWKH